LIIRIKGYKLLSKLEIVPPMRLEIKAEKAADA